VPLRIGGTPVSAMIAISPVTFILLDMAGSGHGINDSASSGCSQSASCEMTFTMDNGLLNVLFRWDRIVYPERHDKLIPLQWNI
jgi:hypothetical protein